MRKKKFPFPVKIPAKDYSSKQFIDSIREPILSSSHLLLSGGKEFTMECATTSMNVKESVKNVM
jgi:hypothetical protein